MIEVSRRRFLGLAGAGMVMPFVGRFLDPHAISAARSFRIRAVTAGVSPTGNAAPRELEPALGFLRQARAALETKGYEVQTVRLATQPLAEYLPDWSSGEALEVIREMDDVAIAGEASLSLGPVITANEHVPGFASWAAELVQRTRNASFSVRVASREHGVHRSALRSAAEAIEAIGRETTGGEGNFRFAAAAFVPSGTPFFPCGWFSEPNTFSIGLESPVLLDEILSEASGTAAARSALVAGLEAALGEVERVAEEIGRETGWRFLGIDTSPAPGLDASIGRVIERLTSTPFGDPPTLAACALLTDVLKDLTVTTCVYSGLMLPVLEDPVLAERAREDRYGVSELLLYSSVCGTGLDVVPIPGDTPVDRISALVEDVAALAVRYAKPLSARLLPIPGRSAGEAVSFDNPHLTDGVVMEAG
jgi:hypothetical protein